MTDTKRRQAHAYAKEAVRVLQEANDWPGIGTEDKVELVRRALISIGLAIQYMVSGDGE